LATAGECGRLLLDGDTLDGDLRAAVLLKGAVMHLIQTAMTEFAGPVNEYEIAAICSSVKGPPDLGGARDLSR